MRICKARPDSPRSLGVGVASLQDSQVKGLWFGSLCSIFDPRCCGFLLFLFRCLHLTLFALNPFTLNPKLFP